MQISTASTITHEAVKAATAANCPVCWVGEDSLLFYAAGFLPTADTRMRFAQGEVGKSLGSFSMGADGLIERGFQLESRSGKTMPGEMSGP